MTYKDNAVKDLRIAYIGGGSRGWAWTFMRDLALEPALGGTIVLYDIDKEAAKANEIIGNGISEREEAVGKWKYIVADTLKEVHLMRWSLMCMSQKNMVSISLSVIQQVLAEWCVHCEQYLCLLQSQRQFAIMRHGHGLSTILTRCHYV